MTKKENHCPNCGSLIQSDQCTYCGAVFIDWSVIDMDKPVFVKFRRNGKILRALCRMNELQINECRDVPTLYSEADMYALFRPYSLTNINLSLDVVPVNNIDFIVIEEDVVDSNDLKEYW